MKQLKLALAALILVVAQAQAQAQAQASAPVPANELVFMGSSTIQFWETMKEDFPRFETVNLGVWGSDYGDLLNDAPRFIQEYPAPRYVIYSGDNDLAHGNSPDEVLEKVQKLSAMIHQSVPQAHLFVISIKPCPDRAQNIPAVIRTNQLVKDFAARSEFITFVDIFPQMIDGQGKPRAELFKEDGLHMKPDGYKIWRSILEPVLEKF